MKKKHTFFGNLYYFLRTIGTFLGEYRSTHPAKNEFGALPSNSYILPPNNISFPENVIIDEHVIIKRNLTIIHSKFEKVYINKYSVIARDVTIVTNNHRSTLSIPQCLLVQSHINDKSQDVTIGEDVWVGTQSIILAGVQLGRGCIVGANAVVSKSVPPYALVAGVPAKIIAVKFSLEDVEKHEVALYPPEERMSHEELVELFDKYYKDKKIFGCNKPLSKDQVLKLNKLKAKRGLQDYPHFNQA